MEIDNVNRSPFFDQTAPDVASVKPVIGEYGNEIARYARQYGLDPEMVKAMMQKESNGAPNPITSREAADLGPLTPQTAAELMGRFIAADELKNDISLQIELVCRYLARLRQTQDGSIHDLQSDRVDPV
jgi:soluble lytic murein transglycosylase-like protein